DVHPVAGFEKPRYPSAPAIRRAEPVAALSVTAVNQDDGIGVADVRRNPAFDEHLRAVDDRSARERRTLDAVPEVAPVGDIERRVDRLRLRAQLRRRGGDDADGKTTEFASR